VVRWIGIGAAVAAIAAVLVVVGVGGSSSETVPSSTITDAAAATTSTGYRVALHGTVSVPSVSRTIPIDGTGVIDASQRRGTMTMRLSGVPALGAPTFQMVFDNFVIYMRSPIFARALPGGKSWIKLDVRKASQQFGVDPSQMSTDPTKALDQLRAVSGSVERVGEDSVRGVRATHYRASVDLRRYPALAPPARRAVARQGVEKLIQLIGRSKIPQDVWIDRDKHVRRIAFGLQMRAPSLPGDAKVSMKMREELYDFGTSVRVDVPAEGEVLDATELAQQAGQGGSQLGLGTP
jgi:hypothetical protein